MKAKHVRIGWWAATAGWATVIFALSAQPGSNLPGGYAVQAHFTEYAILAALLFLALREGRRTWVAIALAVAIASVYGISDEFHQSFVPLRTPDVLDWVVDTIGALAGASVAAGVTSLMARRSRG